MSIQRNLREALSARAFTPEQLVAASQTKNVPLSVASVTRWLRGKGEPNARGIYCIATALNCSADEIVFGKRGGR